MYWLFVLFLLLASPGSCQDAEEGYVKVAILGTGKAAGSPEVYSNELLAKFLSQIKKEKPDLVIFTGNLTEGRDLLTTKESLDEFRHSLRTFSSLVSTYLGDGIPLYPVMGNHTFVNSQAVAIFRDHFRIADPAPLASYQLAYSLLVKNVQFVFLATGDYERQFRGFQRLSQTMPLFDWLQKIIRSHESEASFRFVIGHEPAYSVESVAGNPTGMDRNPARRDEFWKVLRNTRVRGYFCSHDLGYDRSNRSGVWQMISGGLGDPEKIPLEKIMFEHFLILLVPKDSGQNPLLKVIDIAGAQWDSFELAPIDRPVHHLRISTN